MNTKTKLISAIVAGSTILLAVAGTTGSAEARDIPVAGIAGGIIGAAALGALAADSYAPRRVYVGHHRHVRYHVPCGCTVRISSY